MSRPSTVSTLITNVRRQRLSSSLFNLRNKNHSFTSSSSGESSKSFFKGWKTNGTPEIIIGTTIISLLAIDSLIQQYKDNKFSFSISSSSSSSSPPPSISKQAVIQQLELAIQKDRENEENTSNTNYDDSSMNMSTASHPLLDLDGKEHVALYKCQIMKIPKYFDGTKSLTNVQVNDEVDVIKEFIGPDSMYHLCRIDEKVKVNNKDDEGESKKTMIEKLETTYNYGWFPVSCLQRLS